jgi:type VI secretion system protein VasD
MGMLVLALCVLIGCSGDSKKWKLILTATQTLNQDDSGDSLPVLVRIYQLRAKEKFQQATFKALWKNDKELLEGDLLDRKEHMIHPDSQTLVDVDVDIKHGAAFLGVMALFRKPNVEDWKYLVPAETSFLNPLTPKVRLLLDRYSIKVAE